MKALTEKEFIETLLEAYALGSYCAKEINSGREWTLAKGKKERAALNRLMCLHGAKPLTDDEYALFCE